MRLEIKHWQVLHALHHEGTVYRAADRLGISQSALSHRLAEAERRLGGAMFERVGRRLKLTSAGAALTQTSLHIIPVLERAEADFEQWADDTEHLVRIGIAAYNHFSWMADFIHGLSNQHPNIQIELVASANRTPTHSLLQGEVDLVLAPGLFEHSGLAVQKLFDDQLVLLVSPHHHLAQNAFIDPLDLAQETYLSYSRDSHPGFEFERFIRPSGVSPRVMKLVEMSDAIVELVAADLGISILSKWAVQGAIDAGRLVAIPLSEQGLSLHWSSLTRSGEAKHSAVKQVESYLKAWF
ncbi:MAG TPA: LysR family transcriptional regulator [Oceanospirillaceae bacterium]|nr:LysR family transcriptional regulator [Oceanospirillaceae bacterium]